MTRVRLPICQEDLPPQMSFLSEVRMIQGYRCPQDFSTHLLCHPPWVSYDIKDLGTTIWVGIPCSSSSSIPPFSMGPENQSLRLISVQCHLEDAGTCPAPCKLPIFSTLPCLLEAVQDGSCVIKTLERGLKAPSTDLAEISQLENELAFSPPVC